MTSWPRVVFALPAFAAALLAPNPARAWYFPEHAEMTRLALQDFTPAFATQTIQGAVTDARASGLPLCPGVLTALHAVPTAGDSATCIPYGVLAAIAGDHANDATDLRRALSAPMYRLWPASNQTLGAQITAAARGTWIDFQRQMPTEVVRIWTSDVSRVDARAQELPYTLAPRDFVRVLDAKLWVIDPAYVSRAGDAKTHFHDPTSPVEATLMRAAAGGLDNTLAQALAHHARSLQLALRSRQESDASVRVALRSEALLEHAFAVHFMEDGFASGHIATDPAVASDQRRAHRHDYFDRQGLGVTRALARRRCIFQRAPSDRRSMGLRGCWAAHGDGFAGSEDRLHVGEAVGAASVSE
jgi:hypothetical protein